VSEQFLNGTSAHTRLDSALPWHGRFTQRGGYNKGYLATIKMNNEYIVKSKSENNDNKNKNTKDKNVRL